MPRVWDHIQRDLEHPALAMLAPADPGRDSRARKDAMTPEAIMIFAAGLGTRMGALTADRPKPLIPVAGRALIDHALDLTAPLPGLRRVVNLHYRATMLRDHLAGRGVLFADESARLLETGGGLKAALAAVGAGAGLHAEQRCGLDRAEPACLPCAMPGTPPGWRRCCCCCGRRMRGGTGAPGISWLPPTGTCRGGRVWSMRRGADPAD